MELTKTQHEVYDYCASNDFVSTDKIEDFRQRLTDDLRQRLTEEKELRVAVAKFMSSALKEFITGTCPKCNTSGEFKWHFLGKLTHPACSRSWYVSPGTYIARSIEALFRTGVEIGGTALETNKKGESGGFFGFIFGFIFGISFRAPFTALMIPIQAVVSISQKKG